MPNLRILITNMSLWFRSGTEMYVRDVAQSLIQRGHSPVVFSTQLGAVAEELQRAGIPVIKDLDQLVEVPDVIHGQHALETTVAALRFPEVPVVFVCHDCTAWHDTPPKLPNILYYVAVDAPTRDRLLQAPGVIEDRLKVIPNGIDLDRFQPRDPLPPSPRKALLFSSYIQPDSVREIEAACRMKNLELDKLGAVFDNTCDHPERILTNYDLVFAKGRCAVEAMACGNAVILCDQVGAGPMMTLNLLQQNRNCSPGRRWFTDPVERHSLARKIADYDASDAMAVSRWIRETRSLEFTTDALLKTYGKAIADRHLIDTNEFLRAASENAGWWAENWPHLLQQHVTQIMAKKKQGRFKRWQRTLREQMIRFRGRLSSPLRRAS